MAEISDTENAARRRRVRWLKRVIILLSLAAILIPIVLCVFLAVRVGGLEHEIERLTQMVSALQIEGEGESSENPPDTTEAMEEDVTAETVEYDYTQEAGEQIRKVYLTFDDGPSSNTGEILDILAEYNIKATFFVVGREDENSQEMLRRIVDEGHTLGMHSYSHKYNQIYASVEAYAEDLKKLQDYLYDVTEVKSRYVRFPGGSSNTVSSVDMQELIRYLDEQQMDYFDWNISSGDASRTGLSAERIVANCTDDLIKHDNAIILMHDAAGKQTTLKALPAVIETILAMENTVILPITDDTKPVQHITITYEGMEE